jgi:hypothetical protein
MNRARHIGDLYDRGSESLFRFMENSSADELESALECFRELDDLVPANSWRRTAIEGHLCFCLTGRYSLSNSDSDRDAALERIVPLVAGPDPDKSEIVSASPAADRSSNCRSGSGRNSAPKFTCTARSAPSPTLVPARPTTCARWQPWSAKWTREPRSPSGTPPR